MKRLYYQLRSWALLAWDCVTLGPKEAWEFYQLIGRAAKVINKYLEDEGKHE